MTPYNIRYTPAMTDTPAPSELTEASEVESPDAIEDAVLDRLFPDEGDDDPMPLFPTFGQVETPPVPQKQETGDAEPQADGAGSEEPAPETDGRPPEQQQEYDRALAALRRAKVPTEGWDDDQIISVGQGLAETQAYTDRIAREKAELEKTRQADAQETREEESVTAEPPSPVAADLSALTQQVSDLLGDDAGTAVTGLVDGALRRITADVEEKRSELAQAIQHVHGIAHMLTMDRARQGLRERFPQLSDDKAWSEVQKKASTFLRGGGYDDRDYFAAYNSAFEDAVRSVYGSPQDNARKQAVDEAKQAGQPMTSRRPSTGTQEFRSIDEREDAVLAALEMGDRDLASRLAQSPVN